MKENLIQAGAVHENGESFCEVLKKLIGLLSNRKYPDSTELSGLLEELKQRAANIVEITLSGSEKDKILSLLMYYWKRYYKGTIHPNYALHEAIFDLARTIAAAGWQLSKVLKEIFANYATKQWALILLTDLIRKRVITRDTQYDDITVLEQLQKKLANTRLQASTERCKKLIELLTSANPSLGSSTQQIFAILKKANDFTPTLTNVRPAKMPRVDNSEQNRVSSLSPNEFEAAIVLMQGFFGSPFGPNASPLSVVALSTQSSTGHAIPAQDSIAEPPKNTM